MDELRSQKISPDGSRERRSIGRILKLFNEYGIVGTWALVGHLFYRHCEECAVCPILQWEGKHQSFHEIYKTSNPLWYGEEIIDLLLSSPLPQEIGFHGYTHEVFDDGMTAEAAHIEIQEWLRVSGRKGIVPRSVVFPRNQVGHLSAFKEAGFLAYRGVERPPSRSLKTALLLRWVKPLIPFFATPEVYEPQMDASGLVNLPASCWIGPNHRLEKMVTFVNLHQLRHNQVIKAVEQAAREKKVVHVWAHPYEYREEQDLAKLRNLLEVVARYAADGSLRSVGMTELAQQYYTSRSLEMERVN